LVVPRAEFLPTAGRALIGAARREHAGREVQALCWEWSVDHDFQRLLEEEGFQVRERKLYVERELDGFQSEGADPFTYLSLAEAGESAFVNILAGLEPAEPGTASQALARTGFQELLDLAGSALDRTGWFLVLRHGEPVGLVLPQLFPDSPAEGTLYWIGLLPGWRGRGWGRVLHARGLELLLGRGARRYIGSTPLDNLPMRRIFQLNGCRERGVRVLLHAQRP
jgi:ribosomal protein S18 acetylase RimI-like enzyme